MAKLQVLLLINFCTYTIKSLSANTYNSDNETYWESTSNFTPQYATNYGHIRIGKEMRMEFDFIFNGRTQNDSWVYESYFRIGFDSDESSACDGENSRYPAMFLRNNDNRLHFSISDSNNCGQPYNIPDQLVIDQIYHIIIHWNQSNVFIIIDEQTYINKQRNPTDDQFIGRYVKVWISSDDDGAPIYPAGNATLSNINITSKTFPTYSPTYIPTIVPTQPTNIPTISPTNNVSTSTITPTINPTIIQSINLTINISRNPTINPETKTSITIGVTNTDASEITAHNTPSTSVSSNAWLVTQVILISVIACLCLIIIVICLSRWKKSQFMHESNQSLKLADSPLPGDDKEDGDISQSSDMYEPGAKTKCVEGNHLNKKYKHQQEGTLKEFDDDESIEAMYQPVARKTITPRNTLTSSNTLQSIKSTSSTPGATRRDTEMIQFNLQNSNNIGSDTSYQQNDQQTENGMV